MKKIEFPEHVEDPGCLQALSNALGNTIRLIDAVEQQERHLHHRSEVQSLLAERRMASAVHQIVKGILRSNDRLFSTGFITLSNHYLHMRRRLEGTGYAMSVATDLRQNQKSTTSPLDYYDF